MTQTELTLKNLLETTVKIIEELIDNKEAFTIGSNGAIIIDKIDFETGLHFIYFSGLQKGILKNDGSYNALQLCIEKKVIDVDKINQHIELYKTYSKAKTILY